jgi:hypothetical protein
MKKSIAIINTSLQLLNVIEAIHHHQCAENYLIVGHFNIFPERIKQLRKILKDPFVKKNFKKIYFLPSHASSKSPIRFVEYLFGSIKLFFILLFINKVDFLFSGVYTDLYQRQANFLISSFNKSTELWIIDEGVRVLADVVNRNNILSEELLQKQKDLNWVVNFCNSIKRKWHPPVLHFFSAHDLPVKGKDTLIKNTMSYWRKNNPYSYSCPMNAIAFIGQPLVELNIISLHTYKNYISKILHDVGNFHIYYFPHPMETRYTELLPEHVKIVNSLMPTELLLMGTDIKGIVGFNSTVLYNAAVLNICSNITSYWINPSDYLQIADMEVVNNLIRAFEKRSIKTVFL